MAEPCGGTVPEVPCMCVPTRKTKAVSVAMRVPTRKTTWSGEQVPRRVRVALPTTSRLRRTSAPRFLPGDRAGGSRKCERCHGRCHGRCIPQRPRCRIDLPAAGCRWRGAQRLHAHRAEVAQRFAGTFLSNCQRTAARRGRGRNQKPGTRTSPGVPEVKPSFLKTYSGTTLCKAVF